MDRIRVTQWLYEATNLEVGETLFIPCLSKDLLKIKLRLFKAELSLLTEIDPELANTVSIKAVFKDSKFWVTLTKVISDNAIAFKKGKNDEVEKVNI